MAGPPKGLCFQEGGVALRGLSLGVMGSAHHSWNTLTRNCGLPLEARSADTTGRRRVQRGNLNA